MAEEKEYIVHFYDGRVRRMSGPLRELQKLPVKKIEEAPPSFGPVSNVRRDMERINRALGQGFVQLKDVLDPRQILRKLGGGQNGPSPRM